MTFEDVMRIIESHEFAVTVNVASDFETFLEGVRAQEATLAILNELNNRERREQLYRRTIELSECHVDLRYENPWDTALAVYLWLMNMRDRNLSRLMAEVVIRIPKCWWVKTLSHRILFSEPQWSDAGTSVEKDIEVYAKPLAHNSGVTIILGRFVTHPSNIRDTDEMDIKNAFYLESEPVDFMELPVSVAVVA